MAFQVGDIKISGTIDDLSFYNSVFGWLVRQKGGPTRKQFKKSPSYARARENSSEFTLCSKAASAIRKLIINHINPKPETQNPRTLYHRLMKLMRLLADADQTSARGQRDPLKGIHTSEGKLLLKNFEIAAGLNLYDQLVSINYVEEITSCKKLGQTNKRSIIKRRLKPPVFRSHSALIPLHTNKHKLVPLSRSEINPSPPISILRHNHHCCS